MMTRTPIPGLSRRAMLRLLGAATVTGGWWLCGTTRVAARASASATYASGPVQETVVVPYHATVVQSGVLARGQQYRLRVSGVITTNVGTKLGVLAIDAASLFVTGRGAHAVGARCVDAAAVGLAINSELSAPGAAARWGPCTTTHVYERVVTGDDEPLTFSIEGPSTGERIDGELTIRIACV